MAWNLINTLNSDLEKGNVFDDLPETSQKLAAQAKVPSTQEIAPPPSFDSGRVISRPAQLNGSTDIGQSEVLAPPKDVASLGKSEGVFDSIPPVNERVLSPFKESDLPAEDSVPANGRVNGTERNLTLGESFEKAKGVIQQMDAYYKASDYGKPIQRGINKAQYEAAKSAYLTQLGDYVENTMGISKEDVPSLFVGLTKTKSGFRNASEIDSIHKIMTEGAVYTNINGERVAVNPDAGWDLAIETHKEMALADRNRKPEKPVEDKTVAQTTAFVAALKSAYELPDGTPEQRTLKTATISNLEDQGNTVTDGKFYRGLHQDRENTISTSLSSANDRNLNYRGFRYDSPEAKEDPNGQLSGNDFLIKAAGNGSLPTITIGKDGEMNASAADGYLKKHWVDSTPVGIWNPKTGSLEMFRYDPSKDENNLLTAMKVKGPEVTKPAPAEGNPYRAEAEASKIAQGAGGYKNRLSEIYVEMTKLDEARTRLIDQRNQTKKPFPALQGFPGAISAGQAADEYDAITAKMQKLTEEKSELRAKRGAK